MTSVDRLARDPVREARHIRIGGIVQGVGFRPFVFNLALRLGVEGWVRNTSAGVEIGVAGSPERLDEFARRLREEAPPLARVESILVEPGDVRVGSGFEILASHPQPGDFQPVSPDVATCDDCLRELFDPRDRRYRYPFINCTHCGPRLTIIESMPYDRPATTMSAFPMCDACAAEYRDPADRRFHAEPIACPRCGPVIWFEVDGRRIRQGEEALQEARQKLGAGKILAVKGLGGFHLACDARDEESVQRLRRRKERGEKPLAVMFADLDAIRQATRTTPAEESRLGDRVRPIVVVPEGEGSGLAPSLSPGQDTVGAMLPYTPLHHLLLERAPGFPTALVMTSGNRSEEPIVIDNPSARRDLAAIADGFLLHDRGIHQRCDDSVVRVVVGGDYPLRRARGYVPEPVSLAAAGRPLLAVGAEQKNTFCLTRDGRAFLGPHIGDLENEASLDAFAQAIDHFESLFHIAPEALACDLHPDYLATRYAERRAEAAGLPLIRVQHHQAHIASCLAESGLPFDEPAIGFAFDGTGYGWDGAVWGGEVLLADQRSAERVSHLVYVPLPGGEAAIRQPWRMALAWLHRAGVPWEEDLACVAHASPDDRAVLTRHLRDDASAAGLLAPPTSSLGRLFDAVAALIGVRQEVRDEGQAAIELEAICDPAETERYAFEIGADSYDASPVIRAIVQDLRRGLAPGRIAARFHHAVAGMVSEEAQAARRKTGVRRVALSGGVWQNVYLLSRVVDRLERAGFEVHLHRRVPANDGGIALGQAAIASRQLG
ncbi:MAG TPA: carbamoyltransferase HypF [Anaerolineales bacterium]|nr:carbamoyltransferase HypF [Anaerolineales bacterium]